MAFPKSNHEIINVCMLTPYYPPNYSGGSIQAHRINKQLLHRNINVTVLTKRLNINDPEEFEGIVTKRLPSQKITKLIKNDKILTILWIIFSCFEIFKNRKRFDVFHVLDAYSYAAVFALLCRIIRKPIFVKVGIAKGPIQANKLHRKIRVEILKKYAEMIAVSLETLEELKEHGFNLNRIELIPNGVDINEFKPVSIDEKIKQKKSLGISSDTIVATYVGICDKRKGTDLLIKAWRRIVLEHKNVLLLLVGPVPDKEFEREMKKYIDTESLGNNIKIYGKQKTVLPFLDSSDLFVFPSSREGLPNALMEAMAKGLPCVSRPIGGVIDLIKHGKNGLLCKGNDDQLVENLEKNIVKLIENPMLRKQLRDEAVKTIQNEYSLDQIVLKYEQKYRSKVL